MIARTRTGLAATVVAAGIALLTPVAAQALSASEYDATGDIAKATDSSNVVSTTRIYNDIKKVTATHSASTITVRADFKDLAQVSGEQQQFTVSLYTSFGATQNMTLIAYQNNWSGIVRTGGFNGGCSVTKAISYTYNYISLSLPRACINNPQYVKVSAYSKVTSDYNNFTFFDDGYNDSRSLGRTIFYGFDLQQSGNLYSS